MNVSSLISILLILSGAGVMVLNIIRSRKVFKALGQVSGADTRPLRVLFHIHEILMVFFLTGYLIVAYSMAAGIHLISGLFVGMIFFFGSVFVLLGILLQFNMLSSIKQRYEYEVSVGKKLQEQQIHLETMNRQLVQEIQDREKTEKEKRLLEMELERSRHMEALGLLAGGVAHDLNNVLSGAVSYPDLILSRLPGNSPLRKPIRTIQESGKKAAAIVDDLLTMARRGVSNKMILNLNHLVSEYLESPEHGNLLRYHPKVEIITKLDGELLNMWGSGVHLKKTLMNLVSNATEAASESGRVEIRTENRYLQQPLDGFDEIESGNYVVLMVTDNGVGIDPADLQHIYEPFYTKKKMGRSGTGLGMSVVWGTIQDHHGYITASSEAGKGTVFQLYLPATLDALPHQADRVPITDYLGKEETVVVVDDIPEQLEIARSLLTRLNYRVHCFSGSAETLAFLKTAAAEILILDMLMAPDMDGLELYRKIIEIHPGQKAIITSGFSETDRVQEAMRLGVGRYIKKPYTLEKLGMAIREVLD